LTPETERKHIVIGDNAAYLKLLAHYLKKAFPDYPLWKSRSMVQADAGDFGVALGRYMKNNPPGIYLFGAECCLKVRGKGLGGRLSHLALSFAEKSPGRKISRYVLLPQTETTILQNVPEQSWIMKLGTSSPGRKSH
jgi:glycerate-2-kinase